MIDLICTIGTVSYKLDVDDTIAATYQQTDFSSPEAIKNTYTKTIELKPTKRNMEFFSGVYLFDRTLLTFEPTKRVDTVILCSGALFDEGYIVLDTVEISDGLPIFNVTFYSSVGDFLYSLSKDSEGNSVYLGDLYYGFPNSTYSYTLSRDEETSDKTVIALNSKYIYESWQSMCGNAQYWTKTKKELNAEDRLKCNIVPCPCYSGYSENLDTQTALVYDLSAKTIEKYGVTTPTDKMGGYNKAELAREMDEWEIGDLRSSEQHLAVRWSFILDAIFNSENNGGYTVNFPYKDDTQSFVGRYYNNGFVIFPRIDNSEDNINIDDEEELSHTQMVFKYNGLSDISIQPKVDTSNWFNVVLDLDVYTTWQVRSKTKGINNCYTAFRYWSSAAPSKDIPMRDLNIVNFLGIWVSYRSVDGTFKKKWFSLLSSPTIENTIKDSDGNETTVKTHLASKSADELRTALSTSYWKMAKSENNFWGKVYRCLEHTAIFDTALVAGTKQDTNVGTESSPLYQSTFQNETALSLVIDDLNKTNPYITVMYDFFETAYTVENELVFNQATQSFGLAPKYKIYDLNNSASSIYFYGNHTIGYGDTDSYGYVSTANVGYLNEGKWCYLNDATSDYYSALYNTTPSSMPISNLSKEKIFGTEHTACEFLLQFVKMCNLRLRYNRDTRQIDILRVSDYYKDETIDITSWVDHKQTKEINYNYYDFSKLFFGLTNSKGKEAESYPEYLYYKKTKGNMNGYLFDTGNTTQSDTEDYLSDCIIDSTVDYNMKSQWFSSEKASFLLKGSKCTLKTYNSDDIEETDTTDYLKQFNLQTKYLDCIPKMALFDKSNSALSGYFTAFFGGIVNLKYPIQISDNTTVMKQLNDDVCYVYWIDKIMNGQTTGVEGEVKGVIRLNPQETGTIGYQTWTLPLFTMNDYYVSSDDGECGVWEVVMESGSNQAELEALLDASYQPQRGLWWTKPKLLYSNTVLPSNTLYSSVFAPYISDIYDSNTFTVTMYVRFPPQTNISDMFRKFIWIDNALFVLNKVTDYNPEGHNLTQCEFIKVHNKYSYI